MERGRVVTIRDNIAANLRALCGERGSIAQVCREVGINRQQFSRYLTGEAVPNKTNLAKICRYFAISDSDLFGTPLEDHSAADIANPFRRSAAEWRRTVEVISKARPASIEDGAYYVYYGLTEEGAEIARSVMYIKSDGNLKTFRRITNISELKPTTWHYYRGDHKGIILEMRHWLYFLAIANEGKEEPSMIAAHWMGVTPPLLSGVSIVGGISEPMALPVVIEPITSGATIRTVLKGCNLYAMESTEISPIIKNVLRAQKSKMTAS